MPDNPIDDILSRATQDIRKLLEEAFEAGRNDMRRELLAVLSHTGQPAHFELAGSDADLQVGRAPSGTVKPTIKAYIENAKDGILTSEIIEKTGFKVNSVRGTLSTLKAEGFADRRGELWFLSERKGSPALASEPS
jgi:hypothetical protein